MTRQPRVRYLVPQLPRPPLTSKQHGRVAHCKECVGNPISGSTRDAEDEWDVAERDFINGDGKRDPVAEEDGVKKGLICIFRDYAPLCGNGVKVGLGLKKV
ncbi:hypothetical protein TNCV_2797491 [Trichonephila clavipes]|nr:hypothetical protein TNCV_2797491 [Trichonephila clavipes]